MKFEKVLLDYLRGFQKACLAAQSSGIKSSEMITRPVVHKFIEDVFHHVQDINKKLIIHHDTTYSKSDRPDWRIEDFANFGIYCFGDQKGLSYKSPLKLKPKETDQIERYLSFGHPVFVFDGIEFLFYEKDINNPLRLEIISKPVSMKEDWVKKPKDYRFLDEFKRLIKNTGFRQWNESQLIQQLAFRARVLADGITDLLRAPNGSGESEAENSLIEALKRLLVILSRHHDDALHNEEACGDFIAQVLTFGLFYAHTRLLQNLSTPEDRGEAIKQFWRGEGVTDSTKSLKIFYSIINDLAPELNGKNVLGNWHEEVSRVLAHAEYVGVEKSPKDFHALFEQFLTNFDKKTRFDRGAFYTPKPLTSWVVSGTNSLFKNYFGLSGYDSIEKIIDPCCGTGSFLEAVAAQFTELKESSILVGFEILPAPYALAHYRMAEFLGPKDPGFKLKIILTDTLSDRVYDKSRRSEWSGSELSEVRKICAQPLRVVIGNPPSSDHVPSSSPRAIIETLLADFRPPKGSRSGRQNTQKALNNEAYRFLRWSAERIIESGEGILSLVMPGAFAYSPSFKYARKWFLDNFQYLYILELDADGRKSSSTSSIFDVLQGRLVFFAIRKKQDSSLNCEIFHADISGITSKNKIALLEKPFSEDIFSRLELDHSSYSFSPVDLYPKDLWGKCWPISSHENIGGIFKTSCSGIKPAPTSLVFHTQREILIRRCRDIASSKASNLVEVINKWFSGQRKPPSPTKLTTSVLESLSKISKSEDGISKFLYRPFIKGWIASSDSLFKALGNAPGGGTRDRPEIRQSFDFCAAGIAIASAPRDLGATITRFATFVWYLPDNDLVSRGSARIFCDKFPAENSNQERVQMEINISPQLIDLFNYSQSPERDILFYVYAIISCPFYIKLFGGALYQVSSTTSPARIPIVADVDSRKKIAGLGKLVSECEDFDKTISSLKKIVENWPDGLHEFQLTKSHYDSSLAVLILIGKAGETIKLSGVEPSLMDLSISGYKVVESWLRERTFCYLRRSFNKSDTAELIDMLNRLTVQSNLLIKVDEILVDSIVNKGLMSPVGY